MELEKLGSGSMILPAAILQNDAVAESFGSIVHKYAEQILPALLVKFIDGEDMELYNNEIDGVNALRWEAYPKLMHLTETEGDLRYLCEKDKKGELNTVSVSSPKRPDLQISAFSRRR